MGQILFGRRAMIGKLLTSLGLSPEQQKILLTVFKISFAGCIVAVAGMWGWQTFQIKMKAKKAQAEKASPAAQMFSFYEKKSKDLLPIDIEAHEFAADYYLKNDQPQKAIEHIMRIVPLQKGNRKLHLRLGTAYMESGQYKNAFDELSSLAAADSIDEFSPLVEARLGLTLFYLGDIRQSEEKLGACIARFPRWQRRRVIWAKSRQPSPAPLPRRWAISNNRSDLIRDTWKRGTSSGGIA